MQSDLSGKRALVTGAGTRVGAAIACALGAQGMHVAVHYHGADAGALETCRSIENAGGRAYPIRADLYQDAQTSALVDAALTELSGLDLLVPSAANFEPVPFMAADGRSFERAFALNVRAPVLLAQRAAPALRAAHGSIVFITCVSRLAPHKNYLPYQASKAALHQAMRVLALELAPAVRVNAVAPGTVLPPADMSEAEIQALVSDLPLARTGGAQEVARAVIYLARAPFVTGTELVVDGGRSLAL